MPTPFEDPQVAAHFAAYPAAVKKKMLSLRELIFEVAAQSPAMGALEETLKWGEPAYLTAQSKSARAFDPLRIQAEFYEEIG